MFVDSLFLDVYILLEGPYCWEYLLNFWGFFYLYYLPVLALNVGIHLLGGGLAELVRIFCLNHFVVVHSIRVVACGKRNSIEHVILHLQVVFVYAVVLSLLIVLLIRWCEYVESYHFYASADIIISLSIDKIFLSFPLALLFIEGR